MARHKVALNTYIDPEVVERLDRYVTAQKPFPPSKTAIVELALVELLDRLEGKKSRPSPKARAA